MNNKNYEAPEVTVMRFLSEDVITTSELNSTGENSGETEVDWGTLFGGN